MNSCNFKSKKKIIDNFIKNLIPDLNIENADDLIKVESLLSTFISDNLVENVLGINYLNKLLVDNQIPLKLENNLQERQTMLVSQFLNWDISGGTSDIVKVFNTNTKLFNSVLSKFKTLAIKYCLVDTSINADSYPIVDSSAKLSTNVAKMKNKLCEDLIDTFGLDKEEFQNLAGKNHVGIFHHEYGADYSAYKTLMEKVYQEFQQDVPFDPTSESYNIGQENIFFKIFALNNFDKLLELTLEDYIEESNLSGDVNRTIYNLNGLEDTEIFLSSDLAYDNALNTLDPKIKLIVSSIPKITVNFKNKTLKQTNNGETLSFEELLQSISFIKSSILEFNDLSFIEEPVDFFDNSISNFRKYLKAIYNYVITGEVYKKERGLEAKRHAYIKKMGPVLNTLLSLHEYLYNEESSKLDKTTRAISFITRNYRMNGKALPLDIEAMFSLHLLQVDAPTMLQYNSDGTLFSSNDIAADVFSKGYILKSLLNRLTFTLSSIIRNIILDYSKVENTQLETALTNISKSNKLFSELSENDDCAYILSTLFGVDIKKNDFILPLLDDVAVDLKKIFLKLSDTIKSNKKNKLTAYDIQLIIAQQSSDILGNVNFDEISNVLNPILGQAPMTTFRDINGNQLGVYRTTSMVMMLPHILRKYKAQLDGELDYIQNDPNYIPLRARCNFLVHYPDFLSTKNNPGYQAQVAIPLSLGTPDKNIEARKQPAFLQGLSSFMGDFLSLILSKKNGNFSSLMAVLIGAYSDKTTLPKPLFNFLTKIKSGPKSNSEFYTLLANPNQLLRIDYIHRVTSKLDLVDKILTDWNTIVNTIITNNQNSEIFLNEKDDILNKISGFEYTSIRQELFEMSDSFSNALSVVDGKEFDQKVWNLSNILILSISNLNNILKNLSKLDIQKYIVPTASDLNIALVDTLYYTGYTTKDTNGNKKTLFKFNQVLEEDLNLFSNYEKFKKYTLDQSEGSDSMINRYLNKEYIIDGRVVKFEDYLKTNLLQNKNIILKAISTSQDLSWIKNIYKEQNKEITINDVKFKDLVASYIVLSNLFRHAVLELTVKNPYEDSYKGSPISNDLINILNNELLNLTNLLENETNSIVKVDLENKITTLKNQIKELLELNKNKLQLELSSKSKTTTKRNNTFTGTIKPFTTGLIDGTSNRVKMTIIDDLPGHVFNSIGQEADLDEFDGSGWTHPILSRMESRSLRHPSNVSVKKTFITIIDDYYAGELKWASDELSNALIRNSKNSKIDLESVFERMSSIPFDANTNICQFYYHLGKNNSVNLSGLIGGKRVFYRDGFNYKELYNLEYLGNNYYVLSYSFCNNKGSEIDDQLYKEEVSINNLYDLYKALGGVNSMEMGPSKELIPSEIVLDLLFEFSIRHGKSNLKNKESYSQENVEQPLRDKFIGIFATKSADKRGQTNVIPNTAWTDKSIEFSYATVDISTGGELLNALHTANNSEITEGTLLILSMSLKGFTSELTMQLLSAILQVMKVNSKSFNKIRSLLIKGDSQALSEEISKRIIKDAELDGTNYALLTLIGQLQKESSETGESLILPLSLLSKYVIKTVASELNKEVIKRKDPGLQGTLNPSSRFVLMYSIGGQLYTRDSLLTNENILSVSKYKEAVDIIHNDYQIDFDKILLPLIIASKNSDLNLCYSFLKDKYKKNFTGIFFDYLLCKNNSGVNFSQIYSDILEFFEKNPNIKSFLQFRKIPTKALEPGDTIFINGEFKTIENEKEFYDLKSEPFLIIDSNSPADLKNAVYLVGTNDYVESNYTSAEAYLAYSLKAIDELKKSIVTVQSNDESNVEEINRLSTLQGNATKKIIDFIRYADPSLQFAIGTSIDNPIIKSTIQSLQEKATQFKDSLKALGFLIKGEPEYSIEKDAYDYELYYNGFDITRDLEEQVKERWVHDFFSELQAGNQKAKMQIDTQLHFYEMSPKFRSIVQQLKEKCFSINTNTWDYDKLFEYLEQNPVVGFELLSIDRKNDIVQYLKYQTSFEPITNKVLKKAQLIMPKIYRDKLLLGAIDLTKVNPEFYKKAPVFYALHESLINEDGSIKPDFVIRSFSKSYYITTAEDFSDESLQVYGSTVPDSKIIIDEDGYRIDPRTKKQLYKLPSREDFIIKVNHGKETIIFKLSEDTIENIKTIFESDTSIVSIQPFLTSLLSFSSIGNLISLVNTAKELNSIPVFDNMYEIINANLQKNKNVNNRIKLPKSEIENLSKNLGILFKDNYKKYAIYYRNGLYVSFLKSLLVISSRIPTLNMSSIMDMDVVSLLNTDVNNVFVTKALQWLQGSDYDIDKAYILGYNFDENGRFYRWSPLQKDYDINLFNVGLQLPLPTGNVLISKDEVWKLNGSNYNLFAFSNDPFEQDLYVNRLILNYIYLNQAHYTLNDIADILTFADINEDLTEADDDKIKELYVNDLLLNNNIKPISDKSINKEIANILILSKLINRVNEVGALLINSKYQSSEFFNNIITKINKHNTSIPLPEAIKNFMVNKIHTIMSDFRNLSVAQKSIDIATKKFTNVIESIPENYLYNIDDNHTIGLITQSAAVGKDGVGIGANAAKDYFSLLQCYNNYFRLNPPLTLKDLQDSFKFNLKKVKLNYITVNNEPQVFEGVFGPISDVKLNTFLKTMYNILASRVFEFKDDAIEIYHYTDDAAQDIGALISLAADNAKTLGLDKMNGGTEYLAMHLYLAMMGVPADVIIGYFRAPIFYEFINRLPNTFGVEINLTTFNDFIDSIKLEINDTSDSTKLIELQNKLLLAILLKEIYECGQELTQLAGVLKINQGIKVDEKELINIKNKVINIHKNGVYSLNKAGLINDTTGYFNTLTEDSTETSDELLNIMNYYYPKIGIYNFDNITNENKKEIYYYVRYINYKMENANTLMKNVNVSLNDGFNFTRFLKDPEYRKCISAINELYKHTFNIFDSLSDMPHFLEMLNSYNAVLLIYSDRTAILNFEMNVMPELYKGYLIDSSDLDPLTQLPEYKFKVAPNFNVTLLPLVLLAVKDYFLSKFLTLPEFNKNNFTFSKDDVEYNIKYTSDENLHEFLDFMNDVVFPELITKYPNNEFLKGLQLNNEALLKQSLVLRGFAYNLQLLMKKDTEGVRFRKILKDFDFLSKLSLYELFPEATNQNLKNIKLQDLFWLYESLMKIVNPRMHGFSDLFINLYKDPSSWMYQYMKYTIKYDLGEQTINYDPYLLLASMYRLYAQKTGNKIKFIYDKINKELHPSIDFMYIIDKKSLDSKLQIVIKKTNTSRLLVNIPTKSENTKAIELVEKLKYGILNGLIKIDFNLNCE